MDYPLISVIIPVYNSAPFIKEAIESVLNQTYKNLEILVLDDASTDDSILILKKYNDSRLKIFDSKVNKGQAYRMNKGIEYSQGHFISIMHSDDIMHPTKLEKQYQYLSKNKEKGICGCNVRFIGDYNRNMNYPQNNQDCKDMLLSTVPFAHSTVLMHLSVISDMKKKYDQQFVPAEDYELWVRLALITKFGNVQETLFDYRVHKNQISVVAKDKESVVLKEVRKEIIEKLFGIVPDFVDSCTDTFYYDGSNDNNEDLNNIKMLLESNAKKKFFSDKVIHRRLNHLIYKIFSKVKFSHKITLIRRHGWVLTAGFFKPVIHSFISSHHHQKG